MGRIIFLLVVLFSRDGRQGYTAAAALAARPYSFGQQLHGQEEYCVTPSGAGHVVAAINQDEGCRLLVAVWIVFGFALSLAGGVIGGDDSVRADESDDSDYTP